AMEDAFPVREEEKRGGLDVRESRERLRIEVDVEPYGGDRVAVPLRETARLVDHDAVADAPAPVEVNEDGLLAPEHALLEVRVGDARSLGLLLLARSREQDRENHRKRRPRRRLPAEETLLAFFRGGLR